MSEREPPALPDRMSHVHQGECRITEDPRVVMTTMLGSCVAACLRDPEARVGEHESLSVCPRRKRAHRTALLRYGAHFQIEELLVNGLLSIGARRERLQAKLFGGGANGRGSQRYRRRERRLRRAVPGARRHPHHRRKPSRPARQAHPILACRGPLCGSLRSRWLWRPCRPSSPPTIRAKDHGSVELF